MPGLHAEQLRHRRYPVDRHQHPTNIEENARNPVAHDPSAPKVCVQGRAVLARPLRRIVRRRITPSPADTLGGAVAVNGGRAAIWSNHFDSPGRPGCQREPVLRASRPRAHASVMWIMLGAPTMRRWSISRSQRSTIRRGAFHLVLNHPRRAFGLRPLGFLVPKLKGHPAGFSL